MALKLTEQGANDRIHSLIHWVLRVYSSLALTPTIIHLLRCKLWLFIVRYRHKARDAAAVYGVIVLLNSTNLISIFFTYLMRLFILWMRQLIMRILANIRTLHSASCKCSYERIEWPSHAARIEHENWEMAKAKELLEHSMHYSKYSLTLCLIITLSWLWMPPGLAQPVEY